MKRILVISPYSVADDNAIGITLNKFFGKYPGSHLFYVTVNTDAVKCESSNVYHYEYIRRNNGPNTKLSQKANSDVTSAFQSKKNGGNIVGRIVSEIKYCVPVQYDRELLQKINQFSPEIIYVQLYGNRMIKLVKLINRDLRLPVVVHYLDSWMDSEVDNTFFKSFYRKKLTRNLKKYNRDTIIQFAGSPIMTEYLRNKYSCTNAYFLMPFCKFPDDFPEEPTSEILGKCERLKIVYTGNVELGRNEQIVKFAEHMNTRNIKFSLNVYTRQVQLLAGRNIPNLIVHEPVAHDEVSQLIQDADILLHVESSGTDDIRYTKYSLSTKIPEYLATGRPILYLGPSDIGVGEFLIANDLAIYGENVKIACDNLLNYLNLSTDEQKSINKTRFHCAKKLISEQIMRKSIEGWAL